MCTPKSWPKIHKDEIRNIYKRITGIELKEGGDVRKADTQVGGFPSHEAEAGLS